MTEALEPEDEMIAKLSDYLDGLLPAAEKAEVAARIEADPAWKEAHAEMVETRNALSGLQKARAPATFAQDVTSTIHKRSAGRFFARRTLGDRVPFGVLVVFAVLALIIIAFVMWTSETGSLKVDKAHPHATPPAAVSPVPKP